MKTKEMIENHPLPPHDDLDALVQCINDCFACAQACTSCADACVHEDEPQKMAFCIHTDLDCADLCTATGRILSRASRPETAMMQALLEACAAACAGCAEECEQHAGRHGHCRICAEACRACEESCRALCAATPVA